MADGTIERSVERTGKPGRPAHLFRISEAGKNQPVSGDSRTMLTDLQARRAYALMKKGMSEDRAIAAVTKGWTKPVERVTTAPKGERP